MTEDEKRIREGLADGSCLVTMPELLALIADMDALRSAPSAREAWDEGYKQGMEDERTSEANIGIAGFGAKVFPARQNPYLTSQADDEQFCGHCHVPAPDLTGAIFVTDTGHAYDAAKNPEIAHDQNVTLFVPAYPDKQPTKRR